jgi:hypothetical protein
VHNALAALGLAQVGPLHEGILAEGREARVSLDLPAGCTTLVVMGGDGVRDIDAAIVGSKGGPIAHDTTSEPQAVLRACLEEPDACILVVKAAAGTGSWIAATWRGGAGAGDTAGAAGTVRAGGEPTGTCESPIPLSEGSVSSTTARGESIHAGSCAKNSARELVYVLDVPRRQRVVLEVDARFDSVLYVRKDDCADEKAEVACNDDPPEGGRNQSRIERVFEPGRYFVFVDGYSQEGGAFKLTASMSDVVGLAEECRHAPVLASGEIVTGRTSLGVDDAHASCGGGAEGPDAPWHVDLPMRARVRVVEHSDDMAPVVHVRRACAEPASESACSEAANSGGDAVVTGVFERGGYTVFADAREANSSGSYSLQLEVEPPDGTGVVGDSCGDAQPFPVGTGAAIAGDTFAARDDVAGSCGGAGAADVVYRVDVLRRSRLFAQLQSEEAPHLLLAWRRCAERAYEVSCGRALDEVLAPGTYFVAVDGASPEAVGRFNIAWTLQDLSAQGAACASAPVLVPGRPTTATTVGAADTFAASCAGGDTASTGADRVYRFALAARTTVRLALNAAGFNAALALRKACADPLGAADIAEIGCESESDARRRTVIERTLEAGSYWAVVDGQSPAEKGTFTLEYRVVR